MDENGEDRETQLRMIILLTTLMMILSSNDQQFIIHKCLADENDCAN